jgi:hypothetical protein
MNASNSRGKLAIEIAFALAVLLVDANTGAGVEKDLDVPEIEDC